MYGSDLKGVKTETGTRLVLDLELSSVYTLLPLKTERTCSIKLVFLFCCNN